MALELTYSDHFPHMSILNLEISSTKSPNKFFLRKEINYSRFNQPKQTKTDSFEVQPSSVTVAMAILVF